MALSDIYIKIDSIDGEATATGVEKWIEIESVSDGVSNAPQQQGGGHASGRASLAEMTFMKVIDKASLPLFKSCSTGAVIKSAEIHFRKNTGKDGDKMYLKHVLSDVFVTAVSRSGSGGGSPPMESVSLAYAKIESEYLSQDTKTGKLGNPVKMSYDIRTAKAT